MTQPADRVECGCYFCKTFDQVQDLAPRGYLLAAQAAPQPVARGKAAA